MKKSELQLNYFKQGSDMAKCLEACHQHVPDALRRRANDLEASVLHLRALATKIAESNEPIKLDAEDYMIIVTGPDKIIDQLLEDGLVDEVDWL